MCYVRLELTIASWMEIDLEGFLSHGMTKEFSSFVVDCDSRNDEIYLSVIRSDNSRRVSERKNRFDIFHYIYEKLDDCLSSNGEIA